MWHIPSTYCKRKKTIKNRNKWRKESNLHSRNQTAPTIPIKKTKLILKMSTVIWCPRLHKPFLIFLCGPPIPLTTVKCVELAIEIVSRSLVLFAWIKFGSIGMFVPSICLIVDKVIFVLYWFDVDGSIWIISDNCDWGRFLLILAKCSKFAAVSNNEPDDALWKFLKEKLN